MPAYNFMEQFAELVESGKKTCTIRKRRAVTGNNARPDLPLQLYTGQRTPRCRKLVSPDPICIACTPIVIHKSGLVSLDGRLLELDEIKAIAIADGFGDAYEFFEFHTHGRTRTLDDADLIRWAVRR